MIELVDKYKLLAYIDDEIKSQNRPEIIEGLSRARFIISGTFSINAVIEKHGKWIPYGDEYHCFCSECDTEIKLEVGTINDNDYHYCPHCGAVMNGQSNRIRLTLENLCDLMLLKIHYAFVSDFEGKNRKPSAYKRFIDKAIPQIAKECLYE